MLGSRPPTASSSAISAAVDAIRAGDPSVTNIVIVGADDQIPFARLADGTVESNERDYAAGTFPGENNVEADALADGYYFSDDPFAAPAPLGVGSATLYLPTAAVGRLIQSPDQGAGAIEDALTRFVAADGNINATAGLSTGYSFLASGARAGVRQPGQGRPEHERPDQRQLDHSSAGERIDGLPRRQQWAPSTPISTIRGHCRRTTTASGSQADLVHHCRRLGRRSGVRRPPAVLHGLPRRPRHQHPRGGRQRDPGHGRLGDDLCRRRAHCG